MGCKNSQTESEDPQPTGKITLATGKQPSRNDQRLQATGNNRIRGCGSTGTIEQGGNAKEDVSNKTRIADDRNLFVWSTNADQLTTEKMIELKARLTTSTDIPHIIAISEVKIKRTGKSLTLEEMNIPEYEMEERNTSSEHGRGMIVYIHKSVNYRVMETHKNFEESITITVGNIIIAAFYRSPNSSSENNLALNRTITSLSSVNPSAIVLCVGDFNYPSINWTSTSAPGDVDNKENTFIETLNDCFLTQLVNEPTRRRGMERSNTLDLVISNEPDAVLSVDMASGLGKSDHGMTQVMIIGQFKMDTAPRKYLNYNRGDYDGLRQYLTRDWTTELSTFTTVQEKWDHITTEYNKAVQRFIPEQKVCPWKKFKHPLSTQTRKKLKKKNKLWKKYVKSNDERTFTEYKRLRNQVRRATRKEEKMRERDIVDNVKTNPKKILVLRQQKD